ncbi:hypothetical protein K1719_007134 [Acacia pycnantha]|nr:hypothetical protein K1719_007134 [Acacia pycnantha]
MGHSWMNALRTSEEYENGVEEFIEFARRNVATKNGITWIWHGEEVSTSASHENEVEVDDDGMERMIYDVEVESFAQSREYDSVQSDAETPLFPGCTKYTRLTGTLHLVNLKATCGWTDSSFTSLLELLCDMLSDDNVLPDQGLSNCPKCKTSRYKVKKGGGSGDKTTKRQPLKALWYLPIIPQFKRLFTSEATMKKLRWHSDERISDGKYLWRPTDSLQ